MLGWSATAYYSTGTCGSSMGTRNCASSRFHLRHRGGYVRLSEQSVGGGETAAMKSSRAAPHTLDRLPWQSRSISTDTRQGRRIGKGTSTIRQPVKARHCRAHNRKDR